MATEWKEDEAEIEGEFDGGCGLETKRRRELRVGKESTEMADEAAAAIAGEESRSVYFDEEEGIWKCRHCSWTYQLLGPGIDLSQKHKSNYQLVMEFKILTRIKGTENFSSDNAEKQLENGKPEVKYRLEHLQIIPVEEENQDPNSIKVGNKLNSHNAVEYSESITVTLPDTQTQENNGIAKMAKHVAELDLEKVLEEQETHDLFCPNCHSCITKKVILRKRKRKLQSVQHEERPEKLRQVESITNIQETSYDNEPDIFKCLSCFSFFIPTENGFNIFRIFRKREVSVSMHDSNEHHPGQASSRDGNWFSSIFKAESNSNKANEAEAATQLPVEFKISSSGDQLPIKIKRTLALSTSEATKVGDGLATNEKIDSASTQFPDELKVSSGWGQLPMEIKGALSLPTSDAANVGESHLINGKIISEAATQLPVEFKVSSSGDQLPIEIKGTRVLSTSEAAKVGDGLATNGSIDSAPTQFPVELKVSSGWGQLPMEIKGALSIPTSEAADIGESHAINGKIISEVDSIIPIVTVGPSFSKPTSQEDPSIGISAPATTVLLPQGDVQIHLGNQISLEPLRGNEWEVMKSIIYGGLIESITSLGVVSSAAGAQTMTWNVVALGLANLIGGFFVILHDLSELKSSAAPNQKDEQDSRYWKLLGRKSNFSLHATVCIVSYILFGLIPPVTYGFSFRKSDDKSCKMIAVAAASLLCIAFLAVGKGHVSEPKSYIKTFIYYIGLGFTASGLSYVAGIMINGFLEQLGLFEHNAPVPPPPSIELFGVNSVLTSWASD